MKNLMHVCRRLLRRRCHKRSTVKDEIYVSVSFSTDEYRELNVRLVDISMGGASFIYQGCNIDFESSGCMQLFSSTPNSERLKFETVSDTSFLEGNKTSKPYRLRAVQFKKMRALQKKELETFISQVAFC